MSDRATAERLHQTGLDHVRHGRFSEAADCFRQAVEADPGLPRAHNHLGAALVQLGRLDEAVAVLERAIAADPAYAEAHHNLGYALNAAGRHDEAIGRYRRAIDLRPDYADAYNNLGIALFEFAQPRQAIAAYERALAIRPDLAIAWNNLGNALASAGEPARALSAFDRAILLDPNYADAFVNAGLVLRDLHRPKEAAQLFGHAARLAPGNVDAHANLGVVLAEMRRPEESIAAFNRALALEPDSPLLVAQRIFQQARICDWDALEDQKDRIPLLGVSEGIVPPFSMLALDDDPQRHRARSERFVSARYAQRERIAARPATMPPRLTIGYFSADFHDHATMHLAAGLFEAHDRDRFAIHGYSYGPNTGDPMRKRAERAFDRFVEIGALSDDAAAALGQADGLNIAIDLKGFTERNRFGIFARRAAPIQASFLGYPGTSGASFIDYLVADRHVIPDKLRSAYSEKLIRLPGSYQVNDRGRPVSSDVWTRERAGLPADGFVFCCLNNSYKIGFAEFGIWMGLLREIEGSVLWLQADNIQAQSNLRIHAERRGVDGERIIFAEKLPLPNHLARLKLADLFLDTFNYGAHTMASDALWAGVPVVTMMGKSFPARVAGSLLHAVGLDELITETPKAYATLCRSLVLDGKRLADLRRRLDANRCEAPLFDTAQYARHLEQGLEAAFRLYVDGSAPRDIDIIPD